MDEFKKQIQRKLVAGILVDKCAHCDKLIFRDAWCTQERVIRFTTPYFRKLFSVKESGSGKWKTGDCVMVEVNNDPEAFIVNCVFSAASVPNDMLKMRDTLLKIVGISNPDLATEVILKSWDLSRTDDDTNKLLDSFESLIQQEIPTFESQLQDKIAAANAALQEMKEGDIKYFDAAKYERNPKARKACLAAHGTACMVCGLDFGKEYGPEFAGKIEVHHIVPLSQIGKEYVVDPVKDLVPVCPNCHTALHSKKGGVYTVEELRALRSKK